MALLVAVGGRAGLPMSVPASAAAGGAVVGGGGRGSDVGREGGTLGGDLLGGGGRGE